MALEKMGVASNTYYLFDKNGNGMFFSKVGRLLGKTNYDTVYMQLRSAQDVNVLSILGTTDSNYCDVYFDGMACVVKKNYSEIVQSARKLTTVFPVPLRFSDFESGYIQVLFVLRGGMYSRTTIENLLKISNWRKLK